MLVSGAVAAANPAVNSREKLLPDISTVQISYLPNQFWELELPDCAVCICEVTSRLLTEIADYVPLENSLSQGGL